MTGQKEFIPALSAHAVTRYVQRVLGIDLGLSEIRLGNTETMQRHLRAAGLALPDVERVVLTPFVAAALRAGATSIPCEFGRLKALNGVVRTVLTPASSRAGRERQRELNRRHWHSGPREERMRRSRMPV